MKKKFNQKQREVIYLFIILGTAFLFFFMGVMFSTYQVITVLDHVQIKEITIDLNETKMADYIYDKVKSEATADNSRFIKDG